MDIEFIRIVKQYQQNIVLNEVSLSFREGCINCLMGPSGIGKTTLINLLMGLDLPDSGEIRGIRDKRIAVVFQEDRLIEHWDAIENVKLICDRTVSGEQVEQEFCKVDLTEYRNKPVRELSGGMRRRVAIVRAMLFPCDLVIMDEPFKGLDMELKQKLIAYVKEKTKGKTVIIVTHDKEEVRLLQANLVLLS
ncbi:MAG: ABC transporter ATP-binding protein [Lachnospiraceae bacterium]|jgi:NitT/TauT family transport system ATP-binding protein|nr:ABC transporter ATP-binding protein [Lachnospiraceae bacterium]